MQKQFTNSGGKWFSKGGLCTNGSAGYLSQLSVKIDKVRENKGKVLKEINKMIKKIIYK